MKALDTRERNLAGLARSMRTAIVVPALFALALLIIQQPAVAGFAVFGTFAHQVLVTYDTRGAVRFSQAAMLTLLGVVTVSLGTLASADPRLAVGGALTAGILSEIPALASGPVAAIRQALLVSFLCAVAVPARATSVFPHLAGWLMAGVMAQPALLLIWIPLQHGSAASADASHNSGAADASAAERMNWIAKAVRSGLALGLAVALTRLIKVEHGFWVVLGVIPVLNARSRTARTFWQEQAGTLIGFSTSAVILATLGEHQGWYWLILPLVVFGSAYAASAAGFVTSQAAFTVFAVVLFCILMPHMRQTGILRIEDIAIGGAISLVISSLFGLGERATVHSVR